MPEDKTKEKKPEAGDILIYSKEKEFDRFVIDEEGISIPVKTAAESKILSLLIKIFKKLDKK